MSKEEINLVSFIRGNCALTTQTEEFVDLWIMTDGQPCSACVLDKTKCRLHHGLAEKRIKI